MKRATKPPRGRCRKGVGHGFAGISGRVAHRGDARRRDAACPGQQGQAGDRAVQRLLRQYLAAPDGRIVRGCGEGGEGRRQDRRRHRAERRRQRRAAEQPDGRAHPQARRCDRDRCGLGDRGQRHHREGVPGRHQGGLVRLDRLGALQLPAQLRLHRLQEAGSRVGAEEDRRQGQRHPGARRAGIGPRSRHVRGAARRAGSSSRT